jgi:hypothetical protein
MTDQLQYRIASCGERYRPEFRRSPAERWWFMRKDGKPMDFPTSTAAKAAADHIIDLDEASRAPAHIIEVEPEPLGSVEDWRRGKEAAAVALRDQTFGSSTPARLFRNGKEIKVETKKRRAVA